MTQFISRDSIMEFTFNEENGIITDNATGERCIIFPKARIEQIFNRLNELFQTGAQVIITEGFKAAGKWYVDEIPDEKKTDKKYFLEKAIQRLSEAGIGKIQIVGFTPETGELKFRIWNNIFAEMSDDGSTYCNCVEAYVVGVYEQLLQRTPKIEKTKCIGKNDPYCEWYLKPESGEKAEIG
jgi:predicted hydrocarbon binding protein